MVGNTQVGTKIPVEVIRRGRKETLQVLISELPEEAEIASSGNTPGQSQLTSSNNQLNLIVRDLTGDEREVLKLKESGILVEDVQEGPASQAGIRAGDIVLILNNIKILNAVHFIELVAGLPESKSVPVLVQRRGNPIFLAVKIE